MSERLRVLYLDHVARLSGAEIALARLLPALAEEVDALVVLAEDGPLVEHLRARGIRTEVLPLASHARELRRDRVLAAGSVRAAASTARYVRALRRLIRAERIDLVHTNTLKAAFYGAAAARLAGVPVVWHVRDRLAADYLSARTARFVRAAARVLPTAVIANSHATAGTVPVPSTVVHDAVGTTGFTPQPHDGIVVGMAGRLTPWKGQAEFLTAFARAFDDRDDVRATVIGDALFGEHDYAAALRAAHPYAEFRGFRADMPAEYARLDLLVHYSLTAEPFGQVVAEGMAAGLCVLAAAEGGPAELITDGTDGVLVPPRDVPALAAALREWADDPAGRARVGAAARRTAAGRSPQRAAAHVLAVYGRWSSR